MVFFIFCQDKLLRTSYLFITFSQSSRRSSFLKAILVFYSDFSKRLCSSLSFCSLSEKSNQAIFNCLFCSMMTTNKHLRNKISYKKVHLKTVPENEPWFKVIFLFEMLLVINQMKLNYSECECLLKQKIWSDITWTFSQLSWRHLQKKLCLI